MNVILVMVQTVSGKITKGDDPDIYSWTSKEDKDFFFGMLNKYSLVIMGSSTYEAAKENIKPEQRRKRIVLTRHPEKFDEDKIPGKIEFTDEEPGELIKGLESEGYDQLLLVGGGETNTRFFEKNIVCELYITIEPLLFGQGKQVIADGNFTTKLTLLSSEVINKRGTLLLHYRVEN